MPNAGFITISQKIENEKEKERLTNILKNILPKNAGAIIRTSADGIEEEKIVKDIQILIKKWKQIQKSYEEYNLTSPKLIYDSKALLRRTLIDIIDQDLNKVIVNDKKTYRDVNEIFKSMEISESVELEIQDNQDLLEMYNLKAQLEKIESRKIWLKCGGFITIDKTEALTAIDVNTGKYIGTKSLEQTVYIVNKEATIEISKQLRLRDIGRNNNNRLY